jgi:hypothetical protein
MVHIKSVTKQLYQIGKPAGGDIKGKTILLYQLPWWRKDKYGWPIETVKGHPFKSFIRIIFQNIRKIGI